MPVERKWIHLQMCEAEEAISIQSSVPQQSAVSADVCTHIILRTPGGDEPMYTAATAQKMLAQGSRPQPAAATPNWTQLLTLAPRDASFVLPLCLAMRRPFTGLMTSAIAISPSRMAVPCESQGGRPRYSLRGCFAGRPPISGPAAPGQSRS